MAGIIIAEHTTHPQEKEHPMSTVSAFYATILDLMQVHPTLTRKQAVAIAVQESRNGLSMHSLRAVREGERKGPVVVILMNEPDSPLYRSLVLTIGTRGGVKVHK